jgi:outer membrane protein, multidrug efflux system
VPGFIVRGSALLLGACVLAACKVGPNFVAPNEPVPNRYSGAAIDSTAPATAAPRPSGDSSPEPFWWQEFHDTELNRLEERAAAGNLDLNAAFIRIVEARVQVQSARAQGLPSLNASASFTREQFGLAGILKSQGFPGGTASSATTQQLIAALERPVDIYQLGFDASWELDLFGKVRREVEAANAQSAAAVESRNDLLVSLEAEVAQIYFQLRAGQVLRQITLELIAAQRDVLDLTADRNRHGLASEADVDSARGQLSSLQSQLPLYEQTIATSKHALAVLIGQAPEALDAEFGEAGELPALPEAIPVGLPSTLARRRPDIRRAETELHAATAEIGISVASLFPAVSLSGTYGVRNTGTRYLFDWQSKFYSFGPNISIPIFRGGAVVASIRLSRAQAAEAAMNYRKVVLNALQEVEDGLTNLQQDAVRTASLKETVSADQRALDVYLDSYTHGLTTYINVLTAQLQTVQARQQLAQSLLTQGIDLVKLYKALGGGWEESPPAARSIDSGTN